MRIVGWDTSSKAGTVVAVEGRANPSGTSASGELRLVAEFSLNVEATHSERLLWAIHQVLTAARWKLEDVEAWAVGVGPGSFTGLRIGLTTARTLAHTLSRPLVPLSSLALLARAPATYFARVAARTCVIALTDACKGEVFALWGDAQEILKCRSWQKQTPSALWSPEVRQEVIAPRLLIDQLKAFLDTDPAMKWIAVGEAVQRYPEICQSLPQERKWELGSVFLNQIEGGSLGWMAWEALLLQRSWPALEVYPQYLRASDAELKLKAGILVPAPVS